MRYLQAHLPHPHAQVLTPIWRDAGEDHRDRGNSGTDEGFEQEWDVTRLVFQKKTTTRALGWRASWQSRPSALTLLDPLVGASGTPPTQHISYDKSASEERPDLNHVRLCSGNMESRSSCLAG